MGEPPASGNGAFSTKEMLVRIDSKVDSLTQTVAVKNAAYDVEIALLKARVAEVEQTERDQDRKLHENEERTGNVITRVNLAAGALGLIIFLSPLIWILINKLVG